MVHMSVIYQGDKHCDLTHGPSGARISTDAPKDNHGRGEAFSPTDLLTVSLASCILTTIAIFAEKEGVSIKGATADVTKEMTAQPRRVGRIGLQLRLPSHLSPEWRIRCEEIAHKCPVSLSLHPDVKVDLSIQYV